MSLHKIIIFNHTELTNKEVELDIDSQGARAIASAIESLLPDSCYYEVGVYFATYDEKLDDMIWVKDQRN